MLSFGSRQMADRQAGWESSAAACMHTRRQAAKPTRVAPPGILGGDPLAPYPYSLAMISLDTCSSGRVKLDGRDGIQARQCSMPGPIQQSVHSTA